VEVRGDQQERIVGRTSEPCGRDNGSEGAGLLKGDGGHVNRPDGARPVHNPQVRGLDVNCRPAVDFDGLERKPARRLDPKTRDAGADRQIVRKSANLYLRATGTGGVAAADVNLVVGSAVCLIVNQEPANRAVGPVIEGAGLHGNSLAGGVSQRNIGLLAAQTSRERNSDGDRLATTHNGRWARVLGYCVKRDQRTLLLGPRILRVLDSSTHRTSAGPA